MNKVVVFVKKNQFEFLFINIFNKKIKIILKEIIKFA